MQYQIPEYYDAIYEWKDYEAESRRVHELVGEYGRSSGRRLLDMACGTGAHLVHLADHYEVEGADHDPSMLELARAKLPGVPFHVADMRNGHVGEFDVVLCLFSSIGYMKDLEQLREACRNLSGQLVAGGVLLLEPFIRPEAFRDGSVHMQTVDRPELKVARVARSWIEGRLAVMEMHHLIGTPPEVRHVVERHEMFLSSREEMQGALEECGLTVHYDDEGLSRRGLFVATKPISP